jgi:hypothetical protein
MNKEKAVLVTNLTLGTIVDFEDVCKAYFSNDPDIIVKAIAKTGNPEKLLNAIDQANHEIVNGHEISDVSNFGGIQQKIVEQLLTEDTLDFFESNIIENPTVVGEDRGCPGLKAASDKIVEFRKNIPTIELTKAA